MSNEPATLWGDGMHDDAPGFQALMDSRPVYDAMKGQTYSGDEDVVISGGLFWMESTVRIPGFSPRVITITNSHFDAPESFHGPFFRSSESGSVAGIRIHPATV